MNSRRWTDMAVCGAWLLLALVVCGIPARAADGPGEGPIVLMGASVTLGFGAPPGWEAVVKASHRRPPARVETHGDLFFFMNPTQRGERLVEKVLALNPSLVIAVDFPFWFGYGSRGAEGAPLHREEDRLALLSQGTKLLERFPCPLVLGDFPKVPEAVGRILRPEQTPAGETVDALNAQLQAWAARRTNVAVVRLSEWRSKIRHGETIRLQGEDYPAERTSQWLQADQLHPSAEGLQALALMIHEIRLERGWMRREDQVRSRTELARRVSRSLKAFQEAEFRLGLTESLEGWNPGGVASPQRLTALAKTLARLCQQYPVEAAASRELRALVSGMSAENARVLLPLVENSALPERQRRALRAKAARRAAP